MVYFAKVLGIKFEYNYSLYIHGPYSQKLTGDYYSLKQNNIKLSVNDNTIDKISEKIDEMLETAATIIDIKMHNMHVNWKYILNHVYNIKSCILLGYNKNRIRRHGILQSKKNWINKELNIISISLR